MHHFEPEKPPRTQIPRNVWDTRTAGTGDSVNYNIERKLAIWNLAPRRGGYSNCRWVSRRSVDSIRLSKGEWFAMGPSASANLYKLLIIKTVCDRFRSQRRCEEQGLSIRRERPPAGRRHRISSGSVSGRLFLGGVPSRRTRYCFARRVPVCGKVALPVEVVSERQTVP